MIDATRLRGVVDERAARPTELVIEADAGGEREQPGGDAGIQVACGAGTVAFEGEQVLAGAEHRLDALAHRRQPRTTVGLILSARTHDRGAERGNPLSELTPGVALVTDDRLAACERLRQDLQRHLALGTIGSHQRGRSWRAIERTGQVQAHAPEEARVAAR